MTSDLDSLAIADAHVCTDFDKTVNLYSDRNYHKLFLCSFNHNEIYCIGVKNNNLLQ